MSSAAILAGLTEVDNFRGAVEALVARVEAWTAGEPFAGQLVFGRRSRAKQLELFAQGRGLVAGDIYRYTSWRQTGRIVTRSLPRDSAHCYGAAIDLALVDLASHAWLHDAHPAWDLLARIATELGLESGHYWSFRDSAHAELRSWRAHVKSGALTLEE